VLHHPLIASLAASANATPAQVVFSFARALGILPLTGTSDAAHMKEDLASRDLLLPAEAVQAIESLAGGDGAAASQRARRSYFPCETASRSPTCCRHIA
jgi:diketogulonate reductase-like aldo/keto reductase